MKELKPFIITNDIKIDTNDPTLNGLFERAVLAAVETEEALDQEPKLVNGLCGKYYQEGFFDFGIALKLLRNLRIGTTLVFRFNHQKIRATHLNEPVGFEDFIYGDEPKRENPLFLNLDLYTNPFSGN